MSESGPTYVGKRTPRVDALEKVTGQAPCGVDIDLPGMLFGAVYDAVGVRIKALPITPDKILAALGERQSG